MTLYIKTNPLEHNKIEIPVQDVGEITVASLQQTVQRELGTPIDEQCLIFGGRQLNPEKTLAHYRITDRCTIYLLPKISPAAAPSSTEAVSSSRERAERLLARAAQDPQIINSILSRAPNCAFLHEFISTNALADPNTVGRYLDEHPNVVPLLNHLERMDDERLTDTEDMDYREEGEAPEYSMEQGNMAAVANAQQQMYEHSQALHAHQARQGQEQMQSQQLLQQQQPTPAPAVAESNMVAQTGTPSTQPAVTHEALAMALAGVYRGAGSQDRQTSSSSISDTASTQAVGGDVQRSQQVGTLSTQVGTVHTPQTITAQYLQTVLANTMNTAPQQTSGPPQQPHQDRPSGVHLSAERYSVQLSRLRSMGLTDDVASLHILEATRGDLNAAIDLLLGGGH